MSCGILIPKYVIIALWHVLYNTRSWSGVGVNYVEKRFFHVQINITEFRAISILAFFYPNLFVYKNNVVRVINANRFP